MLFAFVHILVAVFVTESVATFIKVAFASTLFTVSIAEIFTATFVTFLVPIAFAATFITVAISHLNGILCAAAWAHLIDATILSALVALTITTVLFSAILAFHKDEAFLAAFIAAFFARIVVIAIISALIAMHLIVIVKIFCLVRMIDVRFRIGRIIDLSHNSPHKCYQHKH